MLYELHYNIITTEKEMQLRKWLDNKPRWSQVKAANMQMWKSLHGTDRTDPLITELKSQIQKDVTPYLYFDDLTIVSYLNGSDFISWHTDYADSMRRDSKVGLLSIGGVRDIQIREKKYGDMAEDLPNDATLTLESRSLFVMDTGFQDSYFHRIPVSLTNDELRYSIILYESIN